MYIGINHIHFEELDSTNDYAMDLLSKTNPSHGTAISASYQTKGKGQIGRLWAGERGKNVAISIILDSSFVEPIHQFDLSIVASLAVRKLIEAYTSEDVLIKWPNDIYCKDKKVAGILIQNILNANHLKASIIGIGINALQDSFPPEVPNPISLCHLTNAELSINQLYTDLFYWMEHYFTMLKSGGRTLLWEEYRMFLYRINKTTTFEDSESNRFKAEIHGINDDGRLILKMGTDLMMYSFNEIKLIAV